VNKSKRQYTINLLKGRDDATEPCADCSDKYKCDAERLACPQFRYFVNTGFISEATHKVPTRAIYVDIFYKEPSIFTKKVTNEAYD
jgi:hypothetical protein